MNLKNNWHIDYLLVKIKYIYVCTKWYPNLGSEISVDEITRLVVLDKQVKIYLTNRGQL